MVVWTGGQQPMNWSDRIAIEPGKRGGRPVIRGLRSGGDFDLMKPLRA
jgi:hypothetical protein